MLGQTVGRYDKQPVEYFYPYHGHLYSVIRVRGDGQPHLDRSCLLLTSLFIPLLSSPYVASLCPSLVFIFWPQAPLSKWSSPFPLHPSLIFTDTSVPLLYLLSQSQRLGTHHCNFPTQSNSESRKHPIYWVHKVKHESTTTYCSRRSKCVIRLSLGKVNWLTFCKWSNGLIPTNSLTNGVVGRTMAFSGSCVRIPPSTIINFFRLSPCRTWKVLSPASPGNETAWILTRPPLYLADLPSRRFGGGECYKA